MILMNRKYQNVCAPLVSDLQKNGFYYMEIIFLGFLIKDIHCWQGVALLYIKQPGTQKQTK
jgi:hypothetical protein